MILINKLEKDNEELIKKLWKLEEINKKLLDKKSRTIMPFSKDTMPLAARIFPELVMKDIVGVQPMLTKQFYEERIKSRLK